MRNFGIVQKVGRSNRDWVGEPSEEPNRYHPTKKISVAMDLAFKALPIVIEEGSQLRNFHPSFLVLRPEAEPFSNGVAFVSVDHCYSAGNAYEVLSSLVARDHCNCQLVGAGDEFVQFFRVCLGKEQSLLYFAPRVTPLPIRVVVPFFVAITLYLDVARATWITSRHQVPLRIPMDCMNYSCLHFLRSPLPNRESVARCHRPLV
jgi:hypothetical protein